jgi:hypothetical protein
MRKIFLLSLLSGLTLTVMSQKVRINWSEESKIELDYNSFVNGNGTDMIKLCFDYKKSGFLGRKRTVIPILARYNDKLAEQTVREYTVDDDNIIFNNLMSVKGRIYLFTSQYDKESKSTSFFCQPLNIQTLNTEGKVITLGSFDAINKSSQSTVGYGLSKDSTKILMFGLSPYSKKENEKYYMGVYDQDMKKVWQNTVELPYKDKYIAILGSLVTNEGKVGVILKHYDQEVTSESVKGDGSRMPSYKTKLLLYENGNTKPTEFLLNTGDKFIHTLQLTHDKDNNLVLFGLYKTKHNGYINGYLVANIDKTSKAVTISKMDAFPTALVELVKKDKQGSDKEKDPGFGTAFRLAQIVDREDGSKDYLLEYSSEVFIQGHTTYNGRTWTTTPSYWLYNYGDIIDISIKPNGSTVIARIPKMQTSRDVRIYSNFRALGYKDKLVMFFNDDEDNVTRDLDKKPDDVQKFNKSVLAMATVDAKGNLERSIVMDHKETKLTVCMRESCIIGKNRIGLYAQKFGGLFSAAKDMIGILEIQ